MNKDTYPIKIGVDKNGKQPFDFVKLFLCLIAVLAVIIYFCSCSSLNKHKTVTKTDIRKDSSVSTSIVESKKIDSTIKSTDLSLTIKKDSGGYEKKTVIEFDTTSRNGNANDFWNTIPWDSLIAADKIERPALTVVPYNRVTKITITEKGTHASQETSQANKTQEATKTASEDKKTNIDAKQSEHTTTTTKDKTTQRSNYWYWLWLLIPIAALCYNKYRNGSFFYPLSKK